MRLIEKNSPLKNLPQNLGLNEIIIFDALRFTCEMIDATYPNFLKKILEISNSKSERNVPSIFQDCWMIIDNAARIEKICGKLPWEKRDEILSDFANLRLFRNTFQHLEERIAKTTSITKMPLYGIISWTHKVPNENNFNTFKLISGNVLEGIGKFTIKIINKNNLENIEISHLNLHTLDVEGNEIILNITSLLLDIKKLITELEQRFIKNKNLYSWVFPDWTKKQDIVFKFENP